MLLNITGTMGHPAHHVAIKGITFRDTAQTYFDPHGLPSGGDWALQPQGAVTIVGSENVSIDGCLFTRLDGNGVFAGGYHRNLSLTDNEFAFIGASAMTAWGDTSSALNGNGTLTVPGGHKVGPDGRGGEQPRGTVVDGNIGHELGLWQKQSSLWFQAVTAQTTVRNNIFFNGPRAALNFNDQFGGGDDVHGNLLLNSVRESGDHGPWNSWSRVPYITDVRTPGVASIVPATRAIHRNLIIANYFSFGAIDTDDGSSYFDVHDNFLAYGEHGLKSDFGGHNMVWHGNVLAYVGNCIHPPYRGEYLGYNDGFVRNACVFRESYQSDCAAVAGWTVHNNTVSSATGDVRVCGMNFSAWQSQGHDRGTVVRRWPTDAELVALGEAVLNMGA